ncbi:DNA-binding MarR family transcriptional regulator [Dysgonomonas sp. PFB1-18]|uniref:MarR family winged helix-turn-helix transcriptional regulator n=1 Tax=unclassified Dysgonomonas TaxID=2630389 RepID=UPI002474435B|nr:MULTISPECIES: MarR family transcriptional regulator [unclassified Dysgonomonas]MDH6311123.1 DNA-binding MarR family transcriptional regulator [Dysgonomonas sp. PF1-14]MDH6340959.1 DNA-binding MarR family transcriptional regulator [Dysgonomonas sp. PF1-16]MDH6382618.1 DNA-binding MarR family transcriptional regulator [Dysgonomonas sp. PFB1-18]MDH6399965.1 DNA-binding MarR family transcriptional regulator [Dysgonomonas sp. PF1-23]
MHKTLYNLDKEFLKDNGITLNESIIVYSLAENKSFCAGYLSEQLGLSNSRTSRILLSLEEKGYITRRMGNIDKRQVLFTLTESGKQKQKEIWKRENRYIKYITLLAELINSGI